jgi:hypothetical protein
VVIDSRLASSRARCYTKPVQFNLVHHPVTPPTDPAFKVWANVEHAASLVAVATTNIWFGVGSPASRFTVPAAVSEPSRGDDLWKTTCFEAFLRPLGEEAYFEWNFAPSGQWAAYEFTRYREGMSPAEVASPPYVRMEDNFTWWALGATIAIPADINWELGLSAVLEEADGTKSYWALAHGGEKPDFHDPGCFGARLP